MQYLFKQIYIIIFIRIKDSVSRKVNESQKKEILNLFVKGKEIKDISKIFKFTIPTITRQLKSLIGEEEFIRVKNSFFKKKSTNNKKDIEFKKSKVSKASIISEKESLPKFKKTDRENYDLSSAHYQEKLSEDPFFVELTPIDCEIDNSIQKDLSSISISEIDFPKVVFMIVDQKIELETKFLKDYPEWQFLPKDDLNRKTIRIYFDLKSAKRDCNKDQKVLKVPNTNVFRIVSPILISRGISRIVSDDQLIAL